MRRIGSQIPNNFLIAVRSILFLTLVPLIAYMVYLLSEDSLSLVSRENLIFYCLICLGFLTVTISSFRKGNQIHTQEIEK